MQSEEILRRAIKQTVRNGWDIMGLRSGFKDSEEHGSEFWHIETNKRKIPFLVVETLMLTTFSLNTIIFQHSFAKAFWGSKEKWYSFSSKEKDNYSWLKMKRWRYHLQQLVLKKDKLKYLEKFIERRRMKKIKVKEVYWHEKEIAPIFELEDGRVFRPIHPNMANWGQPLMFEEVKKNKEQFLED